MCFKIIRQILSIFVTSFVLLIGSDVFGQDIARQTASWDIDDDAIGITDGYTFRVYSPQFELIRILDLPSVEHASHIFQLYNGFSHNLEYVHRVIFYDEAYEGNSRTLVQIWATSTQELVFENTDIYISIFAGVIWNQQSTHFAFVGVNGYAGDSLLIYSTTGQQILELIPPTRGYIWRVTWNKSGCV